MTDHSDDAIGAEAALPPSAFIDFIGRATDLAPGTLQEDLGRSSYKAVTGGSGGGSSGPFFVGSAGVSAHQFDDGMVSIATGTDKPSRERTAMLLSPAAAKQLAGFFRLLDAAERPPSVLDQAHEIVHGDRERTHGEPARNLRAIADIWTALLSAVLKPGSTVTPEIVSLMMIGLKLARASNQPAHRDHWIDIAGYVALAERCGYVAPK